MTRWSLTVLGIGATLAFGAGIVGSTLARNDAGNFGERDEYRVTNEATQSALSMEEIIARHNQQGYTDIDEIEHKHERTKSRPTTVEE